MFNILAGIVPNIINGLTGGLAGAAVKVLEDVGIMLPKNKDPKRELEKIIAKADPELLLKIKEADHKFETAMSEMHIDLETLNMENTKDARAMYRDTKDRLVPILALFIVGFAFSLVAGLSFFDLPDATIQNNGLFL